MGMLGCLAAETANQTDNITGTVMTRLTGTSHATSQMKGNLEETRLREEDATQDEVEKSCLQHQIYLSGTKIQRKRSLIPVNGIWS